MRRFRAVPLGGLAVAVAVGFWAYWPPVQLPSGLKADRVVVLKSSRELQLLRRGEVVGRFRVALGGNPVGHKQREGDRRTPEGVYVLDYRKDDSAFHLALHVSYPNEKDRQRAHEARQDPGGFIMVHGLPNGAPFLGRLHRLVDWTDGCIAVTNREIEQIWQVVDDGTEIEILP